MQKKILFIANQLFQLMVVTQIRQTVFKDKAADLLLIDSSSGMREAYDHLQGTDAFDHVFITSHNICKTEIDRVKLLLTQLADRKWNFFKRFDFVPERQYEAVFMNELSLLNCMIVLYLNETDSVPVYLHEEGYGSYLCEFGTKAKRIVYLLTVWSGVLRLMGRPNVLDIIKGHYYFFPQMVQYKSAYDLFTIPRFDTQDENFRSFIDRIFGKLKENEFDRKYIFFEEKMYDDRIDDYSMVMKIAEKVGKENLMVKLHPRRPVDRFSAQGIKVSKATGIPWEVMLMQYDFSNNVQITISSAAVLSSRLYFGRELDTYMLYKLVGSVNPEIPKATMYRDAHFHVPATVEDFLAQLDMAEDAGKQLL